MLGDKAVINHRLGDLEIGYRGSSGWLTLGVVLFGLVGVGADLGLGVVHDRLGVLVVLLVFVLFSHNLHLAALLFLVVPRLWCAFWWIRRQWGIGRRWIERQWGSNAGSLLVE
jgi:hypothetical protein